MGGLKNIIACGRVYAFHILYVCNYRTLLSHIAGFILLTISGKRMEKYLLTDMTAYHPLF